MDCAICDGKKHKEETKIRNHERREFLHVVGRFQNRVHVFLDSLNEIAPFPIWVRATISLAIKDGVVVDNNVMHVSMPLTLEAILSLFLLCIFIAY